MCSSRLAIFLPACSRIVLALRPRVCMEPLMFWGPGGLRAQLNQQHINVGALELREKLSSVEKTKNLSTN